jgi:hypothetical protein
MFAHSILFFKVIYYANVHSSHPSPAATAVPITAVTPEYRYYCTSKLLDKIWLTMVRGLGELKLRTKNSMYTRVGVVLSAESKNQISKSIPTGQTFFLEKKWK